MRKLIRILFFLLSLNTFSTTYNVATDGSGDFTTISQVNAAMSNGDVFNFRRGDVWDEQLIISVDNITINAYGNGDKPFIYGFTVLTGSTDLGGGLNYKSVTHDVKIVTFDGERMNKGRYPDNYTTLNDAVTSSTLTDATLSGYNFTGSELVMDLNYYTSSTNQITGQSGDEVTFTRSNNSFNPTANRWFFIQNNPLFLDANGEWSLRNDSLVIFSLDAISGHTVLYSELDTAIIINGDNCNINNIQIQGINRLAMLVNGDNVIIDSVDIYDSHTGIYSGSSQKKDGLNITYSTFNNLAGDGVQVWDSGEVFDSLLVSNCTFKNIGLGFGLELYFDGTGTKYTRFRAANIIDFSTAGSSFKHTQFLHNNVSHTGYSGIYYDGDSAMVCYNYLDSCNEILEDGGAIRTFSQSTDTTDSYHGWIEYNIIKNCFFRGIYLDNRTSAHVVTNNTVIGSEWGIFCNDLRRTQITDNIFYNNVVSIRISNSGDNDEVPDGVTITGNVSYFTDKHFDFLTGTSLPSDYTYSTLGFGTFDNNYIIASPIADIVDIFYGSSWVHNYLTYSEYQALAWETNSDLITTLTSIRVNYSDSESLTLSNDSNYTLLNGTIQRGGSILPMSANVFVNVSKYTPSRINSILGGYYGGYINGGYYGGSIIGTKQ